MSFELTGKLAMKYDTQQVSERFKKREFVVETAEEVNGMVYNNYAKMQLVQNKCEILDRFNVGDQIKVNFNIKGNKWEKDGRLSFITNLDAWRVEYANAAAPAAAPGGYNNNGGGYSAPAPTNNMNQGMPASNQGMGGGGFNQAPDQMDDLPF